MSKPHQIDAAREAARTWIANLTRYCERYGQDQARSPYVAADLCGYAGGFGDGRERAAFVEEFVIARELQEAAAGRPNAVEFLRGRRITPEGSRGSCGSGWSGDRCELPSGHDGPHDNE